MTPVSLSMTAFGPYLRETTVDFEALGENSLFLITGSTGGGKTSILDGMCFALYCRATGGRRSWKEMRCDSAPDDTPTLVDFVFQLRGKQYRFRRSIRVHFVRGSGRRETREEHTCWKWQNGEWELWESGSETQIRRCAEELLGLNPEQFSQVVVLPQGDFLRLLRANSNEKAGMLRTLFSMNEWLRIQEALKERSKGLEKQTAQADAARDALLRQEQVETLEALLEKCRRLEEDEGNMREQAKIAGETLSRLESTLSSRRELTRVRLRLQQEEKDEAKARQELLQVQEESGQRQEELKTVPALREKAKTATLEAARLEGELREAAALSALEKEIALCGQARLKAAKEVEQADAARKELQKRIETGEAFLREVLEAARLLPELQAEENRLLRWEQALKEAGQAEKQLSEKRTLCQKQQKSIAAAQVVCKSLTESLARLESLLTADRAFLLASGLKEGSPCPVCGSLHHPAPAAAGEGAVKEEELEQLRQEEKDARQKLDLQKGQEQALLLQLSELERQLEQRREQAAAFGSPEGLASQKQALNQQLAAAKSTAGKREAALARLEALRRQLEESQARREAALGEEKRQETRHLEQEARRRELLEKWQGTPPDAAALEREKSSQQQQAAALSRKAEAIEQNWAALQKRLGAAQAAVASLGERVQQAKRDCEKQAALWQGEIPSEESLTQRWQEGKERSEQLNRELGQMGERKKASRQAAKRLEQLEKEWEALQKAYQQAARLYRLLSGSNPRRIPIDKYVLGIMLEEILASANRFFARFSRERYALLRSQERAANNAYSGLDLVVLDGMTGHERSVDTLSGGEQFLASLSLALGLSEVVQNQSGCVQLEALFIDEGFGSLDQETLDTAMKALAMLHQGGRTIGIISHVSELRNRIPSRIEVSRLPDGSAKAVVVAEGL